MTSDGCDVGVKTCFIVTKTISLLDDVHVKASIPPYTHRTSVIGQDSFADWFEAHLHIIHFCHSTKEKAVLRIYLF